MSRELTIFFFLLFNILICSSQQDTKKESILVYYEGSGYLQPFIENLLKDLTNVENNDNYFKSVNSFNKFIADNKYQSQLRDLIETQKPDNIELNVYYSDSEKKIRGKIFEILKSYGYFLAVKTLTLGELIEIQFQLFRTITSENNLPYNILDNSIKSEDIFINPKNLNYKLKIEEAVKRLFEKSNQPPDAKLLISGKSMKDLDYIILPTKTAIVFDGSPSGDIDSKKITYEWANFIEKGEKLQKIDKINFIPNKAKQEIVIDNEGVYNILFSVNDSISKSKSIRVTIKTVNRPRQWFTLDSVFYSFHERYVFGKKQPQKYQELDLNVLNSIWMPMKEHNGKKFVITRSKIPNHSIATREMPKDTIALKTFLMDSYRYKIVINPFFVDKYFINVSSREYMKIPIESKYYLYWYDLSSGVFSLPTEINHRLETEHLFKYYIHFTTNAFQPKIPDLVDLESEEISLYDSSFHSYLGIGVNMYLIRNLEIGLSIPFSNNKRAVYNDILLNKQPLVNFLLTYNFNQGGISYIFDKSTRKIKYSKKFKSSIRSSIGLKLSTFPYRERSNKFKRGFANALSGEIGFGIALIDKRKVDVDFNFFKVGFGTFLNNKLDKMLLISMSSNLNVRF
jgi:hypothetical protein